MFPLKDDAPAGGMPIVNRSLIAAGILVFLWQLAWPRGFEAYLQTWGEMPTRILAIENIPGTGLPA